MDHLLSGMYPTVHLSFSKLCKVDYCIIHISKIKTQTQKRQMPTSSKQRKHNRNGLRVLDCLTPNTQNNLPLCPHTAPFP